MCAFRHRPGGPAGAPRGGAAAKRPLAERAEGRHLAVITGLVLWVLLAWTAGAWAQPPLRITFLDVGQGDAVLIESPSGQAALYDGGPSSEAVLGYLVDLFIKDAAFTQYETDRLFISPVPVDSVNGFTIPVRQDGVEVYVGKTGAFVGTICVGDLDFTPTS